MKPANAKGVLEAEIVGLLFDVGLGGVINVDQTMLGLNGIRGLDERPTTSARVSVNIHSDSNHAYRINLIPLTELVDFFLQGSLELIL
jgi:hypothetical protein